MLRWFFVAFAIIGTVFILLIPKDASAYWGKRGSGWDVGAKITAGAIVAGALAQPDYYAPAPYDYYGPYSYADGTYYYTPRYQGCWWHYGHRYCRW